jgi:hypothetical protein
MCLSVTCTQESSEASRLQPLRLNTACAARFSGTPPYTLEEGQHFHGHTIANATVHTMQDCATACTAFQGSKSRARCSAWTWLPEQANRPGSCKLKSTRGTSQPGHAGVVSGYLKGAYAGWLAGWLAGLHQLMLQRHDDRAGSCARHPHRLPAVRQTHMYC